MYNIWRGPSPEFMVQGSPASILPAAASLQSCPTLYDTIDGSPPGSAIPGILQARILELVKKGNF